MHQKFNKKHGRSGFTLIELMIAVAFVGGLLMTIAMIIMQIMSLYNKGLTLKEVDSVSRVVVRDMQQGISTSSMINLQYMAPQAPGQPVVPKTAKDLTQAADKVVDYYTNDAGGRLCTGVYSYVWNTGNALKASLAPNGSLSHNTYKKPGSTDPGVGYLLQTIQKTEPDGSVKDLPVRFVKTRDPSKRMCHIPAGETAATTSFGAKIGDVSQFENMFGAGDNNLMLYSLNITTPYGTASEGNDITALSTFYSIGMVIGTQMGDENEHGLVSTNDSTCKAPVNATMNDSEYCAVNRINFVARTGNVVR